MPDETGNEIAVIRQEGQSKTRKFLRLVSSIDQFLTHRLPMYDTAGAKVFALVRPAKVLKSRLQVLDGAGDERGWIVQENVMGKSVSGSTDPEGRASGLSAEDWRSWDFAIQDSGGREVGRIRKRWTG